MARIQPATTGRLPFSIFGFRISGLGFALVCFFLLSGFGATAATSEATNVLTLPSPLASPLPNAGGSVLRVFGAMMLVVALFLGGVWLFRNWQRLAVQKGGAPKLNIIEVRSLGQRQAIYVVGYQQQRMLLASSPTGISLLSHLPTADENEPVAASPKFSFAEAFQQVLTRKQP